LLLTFSLLLAFFMRSRNRITLPYRHPDGKQHPQTPSVTYEIDCNYANLPLKHLSHVLTPLNMSSTLQISSFDAPISPPTVRTFPTTISSVRITLYAELPHNIRKVLHEQLASISTRLSHNGKKLTGDPKPVTASHPRWAGKPGVPQPALSPLKISLNAA